MKRLWTPWRMPFIKEFKTLKGCVFCELLAAKEDDKNFILHRSSTCFVVLNKYPYNTGHLMVIPNLHTADFKDLDSQTLLDLHIQIQKSIGAIQMVMNPQGFNLGMNLGEAGGAGIRHHMHYHIVPRWNGDTNFMPITAETRVLPETLDQTYQKLKPEFESIE
ncbi:MAG: HIT domain-containing protein [Bdellovibrionales bacterium]|nr:HIT domain-containing protein [Bdellovibrionales bacterium]